MTPATKPVTRLTTAQGDHGLPLVVTIDAYGVSYRTKGRKTTYKLPHALIWQQAVRAAAEAAKPHHASNNHVLRGSRL